VTSSREESELNEANARRGGHLRRRTNVSRAKIREGRKRLRLNGKKKGKRSLRKLNKTRREVGRQKKGKSAHPQKGEFMEGGMFKNSSQELSRGTDGAGEKGAHKEEAGTPRRVIGTCQKGGKELLFTGKKQIAQIRAAEERGSSLAGDFTEGCREKKRKL